MKIKQASLSFRVMSVAEILIDSNKSQTIIESKLQRIGNVEEFITIRGAPSWKVGDKIDFVQCLISYKENN